MSFYRVSACEDITDDWRPVLDKKYFEGEVFVDFRKAFDASLGVAGDLWCWKTDYLSGGTQVTTIMIRWIFSFLFIGWKLTTWPANNCLQISVLLQLIFCSCAKMADRFPQQAESDLTYLVDQKNGDRLIRQLLNSVIAKYRDLSVSRRRLRQIIDLLATDKSQYFAQLRPIIVN